MQEADEHVVASITSLVKENVEILSSTTMSADGEEMATPLPSPLYPSIPTCPYPPSPFSPPSPPSPPPPLSPPSPPPPPSLFLLLPLLPPSPCSLVPCVAQLEQDVKEAIFAMAKQSGKVDPDVSESKP